MSAQVLPKKRSKGDHRINSHRNLSSNHAHHHHNASRLTPQSNRVVSSNNNQIIGSASGRRVISNRVVSHTRHVSRSLAQDDLSNESFEEVGIGFNENKHQILSNFEEWIKMSTDNKINIKNSWQFALIDYFHDLNVIKDGDHINFQRASATLDGCIKIYSNRIDSAATETGKLLSGLASKQNEKARNGNSAGSGIGANGDDLDGDGEVIDGERVASDNEDDNEDGAKKRRKVNKVVESTLVDFDTIRIKKLDQELAIDPLFKKALAEFDEGGAKSLLLNTLSIDASGRVVFDATSTGSAQESQASQGITVHDGHDADDDADDVDDDVDDAEVDISDLGQILFDDHLPIEEKTICPSLNEFKSAVDDLHKAKSILNDFNTRMNDVQDIEMEQNEFDMDNDFQFDDFGDQDGSDLQSNDNDLLNHVNESVMQKLFEETSDKYTPAKTNTALLDEDLMNYFDEKLKISWAGPEHWKVSAFKKANNIDQFAKEKKPDITAPKKKKDFSTIDFFSTENADEDLLFKSHKDPNFINLKSVNIYEVYDADTFEEIKEQNLLPDDIRFTSSRLVSLIQKPNTPIMYFPRAPIAAYDTKDQSKLTDSNFFAEQYQARELQEQQETADDRERLAHSFHQAEYEDFDNDYDGIDFNDALEDVPPDNGGVGRQQEPHALSPTRESQFNSQPATAEGVIGKRRTEFVNFSRVAKRVDIKLLKDNIWKAILDGVASGSNATDNDKSDDGDQQLRRIKFNQVIKKVKTMYTPEQVKELSTSFCFICVLHLANEHGLTIEGNESNDNLEIIGV
ncbi:BRN1 [Candida theae]|uniref:Condensin complex subunit 2 n=1 Tax=Candida theae TaxID=1198502 RepID=A0AAD5FYY1_9ASCO|nr:BRN1 [Candida theae]KAI5958569.1 BRN1 [Candida theae]